MKLRLQLRFLALAALMILPTLASAQTPGDLSLALTPCKNEVMRGDQVCFTLTVTNTATRALSGIQLNLFSDPSDINFFLTSNGGEIHPGRVFWTVSLMPGQSLSIKARSQILASAPGHIVRVYFSCGGQGLLTSATYADIVIQGRLLPVTGVDLSAIRAFRK